MLALSRRPGERIFLGPIGDPLAVITLHTIIVDSCAVCASFTVTGAHPLPQSLRVGQWLQFDLCGVLLPALTSRTVTIKLIEVRGNQARIGIDAAREIEIHREEVTHRIAAEMRSAGAL